MTDRASDSFDEIEVFRQLHQLVDFQNLRGSIDALLTFASQHPSMAAAIYERVACCYSNLWLKEGGIWRLMGEPRRKSDTWEKAVEYYHRALDLDPEFVPALDGLANIYRDDEAKAQQLWVRANDIERRKGKLPPADYRSSEGWDHYWNYHISQAEKYGAGPDVIPWVEITKPLIRHMRACGLRTMLFAGNGICQEPKAFAKAGFTVVALDISPVATRFAREFDFREDHLLRFIPQEECRPGGSLSFESGTFLDGAVCPGPVDVIVSRSAAQLYSGETLESLVARVGRGGVFVDHIHGNHDARINLPIYFAAKGFVVHQAQDLTDLETSDPDPPRVYWQLFSSG